MAFIREYAAASMGDPFSLRVPKRLRKLKVGRALGGLARTAVGLVPGVSSALGLGSKLVAMLAKRGIPEDAAVSFARSYGLDVGDPFPFRKPAAASAGPSHPPTAGTKRKVAAAGPRVKAQKKAQKRAARGGGPNIGAIIGKNAKDAFSAALQDAPSIFSGHLPAGFGQGVKASSAGMGGHHRRTNPTNVKALRRSIRRIEGFERIVKSVQKAYPRIKHAHATHTFPHHKKRRAA